MSNEAKRATQGNVRGSTRAIMHLLIQNQSHKARTNGDVHSQVLIARGADDNTPIIDLQIACHLVCLAGQAVGEGKGRAAAGPDCVGALALKFLNSPVREGSAAVHRCCSHSEEEE